MILFAARAFLSALITLFVVLSAPNAFAQTHTEVLVLSTLHQFHGKDNSYTFEELSEIVESYRPNIIAVELTPEDLRTRKEQKTKVEYQKSIFPSADKIKAKMVPMEPAEPKFSELVGLIRASDSELGEKKPDAADGFSTYVDALYGYLFDHWRSAAEVNSARTDALFEVKHAYQNSLYGEKQEKGWEGWNSHFLEKVLETARANKGSRILVTVGAEHSYWLREKLGEQEGIRLIDAETFLSLASKARDTTTRPGDSNARSVSPGPDLTSN
ncbi:MAG: hypothetical protein IPM63_14255 [Acidobacteriota bacterium]|nr:MAG: hypothetical protein IPM63_14255 [Acidobacteriota bacterium]